MFPLAQDYLSGSMTQKELAAQNGMSTAVFAYWVSKYRRRASAPDVFLEIRPVAREEENPLLEVCYPSGVRLRIFSPLTLRVYIGETLSSP
jgi:hypothetical protein